MGPDGIRHLRLHNRQIVQLVDHGDVNPRRTGFTVPAVSALAVIGMAGSLCQHDEKVKGQLYVAFYSSEDTFLKKPLTGLRVEVTDTVLTIPCQGLPAGEYAFALFQDENGNGRLDTAAFGIPTEKSGFSNNAEGIMGPPSYDKCLFCLQKDTLMVIDLK